MGYAPANPGSIQVLISRAKALHAGWPPGNVVSHRCDVCAGNGGGDVAQGIQIRTGIFWRGRSHFDVSRPAWPAPNRAREGAPNVLFIILDDTGFGSSAATQSDQHAQLERAGGRRAPLQQHAHDRALLAVAIVLHDRAQPSFECDGVHHGRVRGISWSQRPDPVRERISLRDPVTAGLQHLCARQVASDAV